MNRHRMTIIHRVPDVAKWASVLHRIENLEHPGLIGRRVFHSIDDPNEVMVEIDFESAESATTYLPKLPREQFHEELGLADDFYPPVFIGVIDPELSFRVEAP